MKHRPLAALVFFLAAALPAAAQQYREIVLDPVLRPLGLTTSRATDIAADGTVVGCGTDSAQRKFAFLYRSGAARLLGPGCAARLNNVGRVAGTLESGEVVLWDAASGEAQPLGFVGGVTAINDAGQVAGSLTDGTLSHAYVWQQGRLTLIPVSDAASASYAMDMNQAGQVAGQMSGGSFVYSTADGSLVTLPSFKDANGTYATYAMAIDDAGRVIGRTSAYRNGEAGFIYENGAARYLPVPFESSTYAMNNRGQMLGSGEAYRMFAITLDGNMFLRSGGGSPFNAINDSGWIAGEDTGLAAMWVPGQATLAMATPPLQLARQPDFNHDGRGDLLWRNGSGASGVWYMAGLSASGYGSAGMASDATIIARGSFDGAGTTQVLWTNAAGDTYTGGTLVKAASEGFTPVGAGDFNGDGRTDILWWNAGTGFGVTLSGYSTTPSMIAQPPTAVVPAAIADFDADGHDDILYRGDDGHFELWTMSRVDGTWSSAGEVRAAGTGFNPVVIADFNGDGKADIVWAHPDGRQSLWLMDGASAANSTSLVDAGTGWSVAFAGDLNGDGRADLVWRHADGSQAGWLMNGTSAIAYGSFVGAGTGWSVAGLRDLNGDGRADLVWKNADGSYGAWLMNGLGATAYGSLLGPNNGWTLVE